MRKRRGGALPAAMLAVIGFGIIVAGSYSLIRVQARETVYQARVAQAQAIAEAGLEIGMNQIARKPSNKTSISKNFAGGSFTVTFSTDQSPIIASTGYSAPIPVVGRAARTVKAQALLDGFYDFADSTFTMNGYAVAYDPTVDDTPTCTIAQMQSLSSASAPSNGCIYGVYALGNDKVFIASSAANPIHWSGDVAYAAPASTAPFANAVKGKATLAASSATVAVEDGGPYLTQNDNLTRVNPPGAYDPATMILSVTTATVDANNEVTLSSGTFYFKGIIVASSQTLTINLRRNNEAAYIYLAGNLEVAHLGWIDSNTGDCGTGSNRGGCKACGIGDQGGIHIYGQGGGTMTVSGYNTSASGPSQNYGVHARENFTYLDLYCPEDVIVIKQRFLGRVVGKKVDIIDPYPGNTRPVYFFDTQCGYAASEGVHWVSGSWSESFKKQ